MSLRTEVRIHGLRQIEQAMKSLPARMDRRLLNRSLIVGGRLFRDEARARVPLLRVPDPRRVRGAIQRAIHVGAVRPEGHTASVWVRVRPLTRRQIANFKRKRGKQASANPADPFYWRFVEFGTSKMAARPFMRPAFEAKKREAVDAAIADLRPRVDAEIAKLGSFTRIGNRLERALR
jgi:HK97 gp10 family phage protein